MEKAKEASAEASKKSEEKKLEAAASVEKADEVTKDSHKTLNKLEEKS
jgi:hypothetical protein